MGQPFSLGKPGLESYATDRRSRSSSIRSPAWRTAVRPGSAAGGEQLPFQPAAGFADEVQLCLCIQLHQPVPPALVNATYIFENAELRQIWRDSHFASPASMSVISFQLVNLRAAIKQGHITDHAEIHERTMIIDRDLQAWESVLPAHWKRSQLPRLATDGPVDFAQHQLGYLNTWLAEIHCTYRVLRVACLQLLIHEESVSPKADAVDTIRQMSEEVCCSVAVFDNNPRTSLPRPCFSKRVQYISNTHTQQEPSHSSVTSMSSPWKTSTTTQHASMQPRLCKPSAGEWASSSRPTLPSWCWDT